MNKHLHELRASKASTLSILYVEDDLVLQEATKLLFEVIFKTVYVASDGEEGLQLYKEFEPDIVISDILMPKMSGIDMSQKVREINEEQPIIVVSAYNEVEYLMELIEIGIDQFLMKPLKEDQLYIQLLKSVNKVLLRYELDQYRYKLEEANLELAQRLEHQRTQLVETSSTQNSVISQLFCFVELDSAQSVIHFDHQINQRFNIDVNIEPLIQNELTESIQKAHQDNQVQKRVIQVNKNNLQEGYLCASVVPLEQKHTYIAFADVSELIGNEKLKRTELVRQKSTLSTSHMLQSMTAPSLLLTNTCQVIEFNDAFKDLFYDLIDYDDASQTPYNIDDFFHQLECEKLNFSKMAGLSVDLHLEDSTREFVINFIDLSSVGVDALILHFNELDG
jgi:CheY-like chemotaxis protein